ncbi:heme-binding protein [Burkholderia oklahomensis]|uniref:GlcG/HbpS family heme-binding protein n=1 Tax=Burkholderia oklahomensis TaxID=342113 RepID=UPI002655FF05|nr:heme-binding protein [Burkholderia oklahomensis]MDN7674902.1 heme-binding protein [Burkholderia oklahomensis]
MSAELTLERAQRIVDAGVANAAGVAVAVAIAVVDAGAHLVAFARMDDAFIGAIDLATRKAGTSARFRMPSASLGALSAGDGPIRTIEHSNGGLVTFGGGLPLVGAHGRCIGAVGVSGGTVDEDDAIARACVDAFATLLNAGQGART